MNIRYVLFNICLLLILSTGLLAQTREIDSLSSKLQSAEKQDKIHLLNELSKSYRFSDAEKSLEYGLSALELSIEVGDKYGEAKAFDNIGSGYVYLQKYDKALDCYQQSWSIFERLKDKSAAASALNNVGVVHHMMANYDKALDYFQRAIAEFNELGDQRNIAGTMNNIANIYLKNARYEDALEYYQKALSIKRDLDDETGIKTALGSIGSIYMALKKFDKSLQFYIEALEIAEKTNDTQEQISLFYNIGNVQREKGLLQVAIQNYQKSYDKAAQVAENAKACRALIEMAEVYVKTGTLAKAEEALGTGLKLSEQIGDNELVRDIYHAYFNMYEKRNNPKQALKYHKLYTDLNLLIVSNRKNRQIVEANLKYENSMTKNEELLSKLSKSEDTISYLNTVLKDTEQKRFYILLVSLIIFTLAVVLVGFFVYNTRRLSKQFQHVRKKNTELINENVSLKNKRTTTSFSPSNVEQNPLINNNFILVLSARIKSLFSGFHKYSDNILSDFDSQSKDNIKRTFFSINTEASKGIRLMDDMNEWIYIQYEKYKLRKETTNLSKEVVKSIESIKGYAAAKGIAVETEGTENNYIIESDIRTLQTALHYLLDNAIENTTENNAIEVRLVQHEKNVELTITKKSATITQSKLDEILKEDIIKIPSQKESSTMLNLLLAKEYIQKNNGNISGTVTPDKQIVSVIFRTIEE